MRSTRYEVSFVIGVSESFQDMPYLIMKEEFTTLQAYLEHLQSRGKYSFLRSEVIAELSLTDNAFKKAVHRLMLSCIQVECFIHASAY